jgi:DME family drug/metabolite transporter
MLGARRRGGPRYTGANRVRTNDEVDPDGGSRTARRGGSVPDDAAIARPASSVRVPTSRAASSRAAAVLVLVAASLWGTTGTAQALGEAHDPVAVGAARLAVGGAALLLIALGTQPSALLSCVRSPLLRWTALAAVATAVYQGAFFSAVAGTGVVTGTVVALGTAPVATGLCGLLLFGERPTRWWAAATVLAVVGCVVLVTAGGSGTADVRPAGVALALLAGAAYGLYTSAAKALLDRGVPVVSAMAATLGGGAVLLAPLGVRGLAELSEGRSLLMVAWLGLAATAVAYLLFARGLRRLPAATVGTLSLAEPLTATVLGLVVLGERPAPLAAAGGLCLVAGLLLATVRPGTVRGATTAAAGASAVVAPHHDGQGETGNPLR